MTENLMPVRNHIEELRFMFRRLLHVQAADGSWDAWLRNEIEEMEADLMEQAIKKSAALPGSQFLNEEFIQLFPLYMPDVPHASLGTDDIPMIVHL
ncbi:hypothetical protein ACFOLF_12370 [Paenibacillus sepulcri]|uniref:Uncharacterized protein n=1 Tax=Paenibacillus sepulcri TaxID=359917 RepID=A0ABS7BYY1_9BACL|nr:hypothetical protein [Paenibacillus sepulcri]